MKKYLFSYLVICFSLGIYFSENLIPAANLRIYFIILFFCLFFSQLINSTILKTLGFCIQFMIVGFLINTTNKTTHTNTFELDETAKVYQVILDNKYKTTHKYYKFKTKNLTNNHTGLIHIPIDSTNYYPKDTLIIYGKTYPLTTPKNPYQFDYSAYLNRQNIDHMIYAEHVLKHSSNHNHWKKFTVKSKDNIREKMKEFGYSTETRSIISSMLLGDRSEITQELNDSYVATGVVHILSISGLHVVMIYIILQYILKPILWLKNGKYIRIILSLIIIWIFAFYVDMQPPVFRSALMISIYYISELIKRPKNIYHTIALSAFIILIFQPQYLFDVGFQLSFSAVFFIVWLNPIYKKIYQPKHKISRYFYDLSTTSISAQLGTMPFATYYFNQFSGLFLLGNLVLIPASFFMIVGSIIAILLLSLDVNFSLFTTIFNFYIEACNSYIKWLSNFDSFVLKQLYISSLTAILILVILHQLRPLVLKNSKTSILLILGSILLIQAYRFVDLNRIRKSKEIVVFQQFKESLIGVRNGQNLKIFSSENLDSSLTKQYTIRPFEVRNRIINTEYFHIDSAIIHPELYKSKSILRIENMSFFVGQDLNQIPEKTDYILVRNSSFKPENLDKLPQIKRVIADGSNYPSYVLELESILKTESDSLLFKTSEQGYFQIKF